MIENYENMIQTAVLLICSGTAAYRAFRYRSRSWILVFFFYGNWALGDIYWLVHLVFFDRTPQIVMVSDLNWYVAYIFLYMLLRHIAPPETRVEKRLLPWLGPVFALGMAVFFIQWGQIVSNLIYAGLMGLLLFSVARRLMDRQVYGGQRFLCALILVFCLLEYGLWISSCLFQSDTLANNPYYWFDLLLTAGFPFFIPAVKKAVTA